MKIAVVYTSKTGYTKKYAEWISEELAADLFEVTEACVDKLESFDVIIFGGGLYNIGINGLRVLTKNYLRLQDKSIVVFAVGVSPPRDEAMIEIKNRSLPGVMQERIPFFYYRGGFEYSKLRPLDKIMMTLLKWKILCKKKLGMKLIPDEKGMLAAYHTPVDFTRRKNIEVLVNLVRNMDREC